MKNFPVTMKCAGSIFKNLLLNELPAERGGAGAGSGRSAKAKCRLHGFWSR